ETMRDCHGIRSLIRCLLELHIDDPQLVRLAAAAVLTREKGLGWSTEEMESVRQELKQLEGAWRRFLSGPAAEKSVERLAALHLAFREMEEAVLKSVPIPSLEELILRVARIQLGGSFSCLEDVEAAVLWPRGGGLSAIAEDALSTCLSSSKLGVGGASRVACLVGAMLSPKEMLESPPTTRSSNMCDASATGVTGSGAMVC
ncbi:unnamed protein product, partial [Cladocopium goreaui]